jgi:hypothetical protein
MCPDVRHNVQAETSNIARYVAAATRTTTARSVDEVYQFMFTTRFRVIAVGLTVVLCVSSVTAGVTRFEIHNRQPYADGQSFGNVGEYERITGRVFFEIDPKHRGNESIVDLLLAPANERGQVQFSADLDILAPKDLAAGRGAALYDVNNRGNRLALRFFNDAGGVTDPGHSFLMREGWVIVWSGWDGELLPGSGRLQLSAPTASGSGEPVTGLVRYELSVTNDGETQLPVNGGGHGAYRPTPNGLQAATLTWRLRPGDPRVSVPRDQFRFHVEETPTDGQGQLPKTELELTVGFRKGYLYELIYEATDPLVHGVCFASVRDLMSAVRHGTGTDNPLLYHGRPIIKRNHGFGVSQSGRFLREFLYSGFNADEQGRKVFDGLIPHVAGGGLGSFNHRFAQPTTYNSQHELHDWPGDRFPFTYETQTDVASGQTDGILRKAAQDNVEPLLLHTQSSAEYWSRSGSLAHTDPTGMRDAGIPDNVRVFTFGGTQHGPANWPPKKGNGQTLANPGDYRPFLRCLLTRLDEWCRDGKPVAPSVYPSIQAGTLVDWRQKFTDFPAIPGIRYPEVIQQPVMLHPGKCWLADGIVEQQPPEINGHYRTLAAKTDADGNVLGCLLPPEVAVPLATFTGWSLRDADHGAQGELVKLAGSYIPFSLTQAAREKLGDPRRSVEERYATLKEYQTQLSAACIALMEAGYLLNEDVERISRRQTERAQPLFDRLRVDTKSE